jgi:hypothetical protein
MCIDPVAMQPRNEMHQAAPYSSGSFRRTSDLIKQLRRIVAELEELFHDLSKLALNIAFNVIVVLTVCHVIVLFFHMIFG